MISKYLNVLSDLGYVAREWPCGQKESGRNSLYRIRDNFLAFFCAFIAGSQSLLNGRVSPEDFLKRRQGSGEWDAFIGHRFEDVCLQFLQSRFCDGRMPFQARDLGRWRGANPLARRHETIDLLAMDD